MSKVARNALFLYLRSIVNMVVGIFTVRVMIEALGVDDYGLQSVAGGVLALFSFLTATIGTSTSRFLTFELGRGDLEKMNNTFGTAMVIYSWLAVVMVLLGETFGLWVVTHELNIPPGRETAAMVVFQLSVLGMAIGLPQAPYGAVLTAYERFDIMAWASLISTFLRLGILYLICMVGGDHLIIYSVAMFIVSVGNLLFSIWFVRTRYPHIRFRRHLDRTALRPMLRYSAWEIFGLMGMTLKGPWFQTLINIVYGVAVNAAMGIGMTVSGAVTGLSFTLSSAFKPSITKNYAARGVEGMRDSVVTSTMLCMLLYGVVGVPLIVELPYVMHLWLTDVPEYAEAICMAQLVLNVVLMAYLIPAEALKSMGNNKGLNLMQCVEGGLVLLLVWVSSRWLGASPVVASIIFRAGITVNFAVTLWLLARHTDMALIRRIMWRPITVVIGIEVAAWAILSSLSALMEPGIVRLVAVCAGSIVLFTVMAYLCVFDRNQRAMMRAVAASWMRRLSASSSYATTSTSPSGN